MKNPYRRSTRTIRFAALPAPLRDALQQRGARPIPEDAPAVHTISVRLEPPGFFERLLGSADPDTEHETALVLGDDVLFVAVSGAKRGSTAWQLPLASLHLADSPALAVPGGRALGPSVTLQSPVFGVSEHRVGTYTVCFGSEPDGPSFAEALRARLAR